jgi:hypothetical protein
MGAAVHAIVPRVAECPFNQIRAAAFIRGRHPMMFPQSLAASLEPLNASAPTKAGTPVAVKAEVLRWRPPLEGCATPCKIVVAVSCSHPLRRAPTSWPRRAGGERRAP